MKLTSYKVLLPIIFGSLFGAMLFVLGALDDAPGLSFIGLISAFLFIVRGLYHAGVIRRGYSIPFILLVFSLIALLFPIILFFDHELPAFSIPIGMLIAIILLLVSLWRIKKVKENVAS